jgi:hypothetical protein
MEFSLGRDTLPSQARSVRGESRRLRRERDNAKKLLPGCAFWRIAQRDCCVAITRPAFSANWRTAADVRSVHDHLSRHHAGPKIETSLFRYRPRHEPVHARREKRAIAAVSLRLPPPPPRAAAGRTVRIISMTVRDHASLVTHRNYNLVRTTVINSSQRRTCATMLTLTSHYLATNAKHPRYAPRSPAGWRLTVIGKSVTGCEKRVAANSGVALGCARYRAYGMGCRVHAVGAHRRLAC